jgi:chromosome segregation ATPase
MDIKAVKEEVAKGMRAYKAFENAHDVMTALEMLEQTEKDLQKRISSLKKERDSLAEVVSGSNGIIEKAKEEAKEEIAKAKAKAEKTAQSAENAAAKLIASAQSEVDEAAKEKAKMLSGKESVMAEISDLEMKSKKLKEEIKALEDAKEAARKALGL